MKNPFKRRPRERAVAITNEATGERILLTVEQARAEIERLDARVAKLINRLEVMPKASPNQLKMFDRAYQEAVTSRAAADGIRSALEGVS